MDNKKWIGILILFLSVASVIIYHVFGYIGHYGYDDMEYAKIAYNMTQGIVDYNNHFTFRLPIVLLTAIAYSLFGVTDFASSLPPILATISIQILVFYTLRNRSNLTLIFALALTTFSNWFIFYSDKLMPDIYLVASVMLSLFIIHKYKFESDKTKPLFYSILLAFSLLLGFLAKETIILIIPLLFYLVILDFIKKRDVKFWIYSALSGVALLTAYFAITWILTGDISKRFDAIVQNSYLNLCSYDKQPVQLLLKRIFYDFFSLSIIQSLVTGLIFVVAYLFQKGIKNVFHINDLFSFYFVSAIILLLSSNFMSISISSYVPMCLDPRHYLFLIPVAAIPASYIITDFVSSKKQGIPILLILLVVTAFSFFLQVDAFWKLYLPLTILIGLMYFLRSNRKFKYAFTTLFVIILMLIPLYMIFYAQKVNYREQKKVAYKYIIDKKFEGYVITNDVEKRICEYYNGFSDSSSCKFLNFKEFNQDTLAGKKKLLFLNWYTQYLSGIDMNNLPYYAKEIDSANYLIYENKGLNLSIYELNNTNSPEFNYTERVNSFNGFEHDVPFWETKINNVTQEEKYEGEFSQSVDEYSSVFTYPLDSLINEDFKYLVISSQVYCNFMAKTSAKIVIAIESNSTSYNWNGMEINKYLKAYSHWFPVNYDVKINKKDLKEASLLKVYLWNNDKTKGYIDNFNITIKEIK